MEHRYPKTNRALRFTSMGGPLTVMEKPVRALAANEILLKVHAASINPCDIQLWRSGITGYVPGDKGMGKDYSGTVVALGSDVKGWKIGDQAFGLLFQVYGQNTFSEYVIINSLSDAVAKKPTCFTHQQAAAVPLVVLTASCCLDWLPPPSASQRRVIVLGASGGTGSWVLQLAKKVYDCHVTAICSGKNIEFVKGLGADEVIDYTKQDIASTLLSTRAVSPPYDLIVDCVGGTELIPCFTQLLHTNGAYVTIVGDKTSPKVLGGPPTYLTHPSQIWRHVRGLIFGPRYACIAMDFKSSRIEQVVALAERGEVKVEVQEVIEGAFDEREAWKRAVEFMEGGRVRGKIVLAIP